VNGADPEVITVPCVAGSTVARFVALVDGLDEDLKRELVLIGGLTVSCRLGFEHRVTNDVDGLYFNRSPDPIERVLVAHRVPTDGHRVLLADGTKLDVIEVGEVDPAQLPDDDSSRLFIEAHRWAFDTATRVTVRAVDPVTVAEHSTVTIAMARAAALVPMKLRAAEARPRANEKKKASDSLDAYTLLDRLNHDGDLATAVAGAPWDIAELTAGYLRRGFVDNADVTVGRINRWMNLAQPVTAGDLRRVATRFLTDSGQDTRQP
jgi:hypothetical protein